MNPVSKSHAYVLVFICSFIRLFKFCVAFKFIMLTKDLDVT